jgi:rubrerythrin
MIQKTELSGGIGMQVSLETEFNRSADHLQTEADLLFIREDLADEWGAAIGYLECGNEIKDRLISEQFHKAAQDELEHIIRLTRILATLDQHQGEVLYKEGLFWLAGIEHQAAVPPVGAKGGFRAESGEFYREGKQSLKRYFEPDELTLECLRNAVRDELMAINVYQRQARITTNPMVKNTFDLIMARKKEHVAMFTAGLNKLLREYRLSMG